MTPCVSRYWLLRRPYLVYGAKRKMQVNTCFSESYHNAPADICFDATMYRSEPLTQGGELRIKLCASSAAEIISNDDAVIRLIRPGCHSTLLEKAVVQYNERCVKGLFCQGCKTCPESICLRQGSQCKLDGEFDPVFYADKYGNETDVSNIKTDNDKLVNHWTQHGAANRWVGCQGCCPGKAYVPNCAFTVVGCSDAQQSIALDLKDTYRDK